jgi:hypothetical protein
MNLKLMQTGSLEKVNTKSEHKRTKISLVFSIVVCKKESCEINILARFDLAER